MRPQRNPVYVRTLHRSSPPTPVAIRLLSTLLVLMMLSTLITLAPAITGRQQAAAEGKVKLALEIAHIGLVIYEMAAFGGEIAYEQLIPDPDEELLEEVEKQGQLIDDVQAGLDQIQQDLADMFQTLNLYDSMQNAWNTIPNIQNWYNKLNYDIAGKPKGEVSEEFINEWASSVLDSQNIEIDIAQWYTALVQGGIGNDQDPVLKQMLDFALDELNGVSATSDFSATVESTNGVGIIAERPMYFNYNGEWSGGSSQTGITSLSNTFYFAEGTVRDGFRTYICLQNPKADAAPVRITYMRGDGEKVEQNIIVPAMSRGTVNASAFLGVLEGPSADFSALVESVGGSEIIAERPMYFNYNGEWTGGHVNAGVSTPSTYLLFAEGSTRPGFDSYLCLQNPEETNADVAITYMKGDGTSQLQELVVPPHARSTVKVNDVIGEEDTDACDFSVLVESTNGIGIVAERPMYFNFKDGWTGGHCQSGARSPSPVQYFAEGTARPGFDTYLCIQNPGGDSADVEVTYMKGNGSSTTQNITVAPNSRSTITVKDLLGEGSDSSYDFSAKVECTNGQLIAAERSTYFLFDGFWDGGHNEAGMPAPEGKFYFAEGTNRPNFKTFFCIQNPEDRAAEVLVTFMKGDGTSQIEEITVPARSRYTMSVGDTYSGTTLSDAYQRYLMSFFEECLYYQTIGAITKCNALDITTPGTSKAWLNNTYLKYIKAETDLFWSCTEQLVMAAADISQNNWNSSQQYLSLPSDAADIFASADLIRKIAMGQIGLPETGDVVSAGICGRVIGAQDSVPDGTVPDIKVKSSGGTAYTKNFSEPATVPWLSKTRTSLKYDCWASDSSGNVTLSLNSNWSIPRYQFDGPDGGFPDGTYTVLAPSGATIGSATVSKTAFPDPRDNTKTLYLSYGDFTGIMRNKRLACDSAQWSTSKADDGSLTSKISNSFTQDLGKGRLGIWLYAIGAKDTYFKRTYKFTSKNFKAAADMDIKVQDGLSFTTQSTGGKQKDARGYVYSHFGWYRDTAQGWMHYQVLVKDTNGYVFTLEDKSANASSDSGDYTKDSDFGTSGFTNYHTIHLTAGHTYCFEVVFEAKIHCDEGGVAGSGGDGEANQLIQLTSMGVMMP